MLRYLNAGESHGRLLLAIVEGMPAGLPLTKELINRDLRRLQQVHGRGGRMKIEQDQIEIVAGVRSGLTLGSPIGLQNNNRDWKNGEGIMAVEPGEASTARAVTKPRPGHADLVGAIKYGHTDMRNVLEKASARETAMRVAVGAVAKALLNQFGIKIISHVKEIGGIQADTRHMDFESLEAASEESEVRCAD